MIISHRHRFIFVHTRKAAGSSIKIALAPHLGDRDIIIGSWNEILDAGGSLNGAATATLRTPEGQVCYWAARAAGRSRSEAANIGIKGYYRPRLAHNPPHATVRQAQRFFTREWGEYFKFAFVRNPWERMASDYLWRSRAKGSHVQFCDYLRHLRKLQAGKRADRRPADASSWDLIADDEGIALDFVGRYEQLDRNFQAICRRIGIELEAVSVSAKTNPGERDYSFLYGPEEKQLVEELSAREIEAFGYGFPY